MQYCAYIIVQTYEVECTLFITTSNYVLFAAIQRQDQTRYAIRIQKRRDYQISVSVLYIVPSIQYNIRILLPHQN